MSRLIDADAFAKYLRENLDVWKHPEALDWAICKLEHAPPVDAVPVVHGRWFLLDECSNAGVYCSACRKKVYKENYANQKLKSKYCPNCGAKMDLEVDGE